ncbi:MAG: hypothetical protein U0T56_10760 [Ferruginibacter sp.]
MKKIIIPLFCMLFLQQAQAQMEYSEKFLNAMKRNLSSIDSSFSNPPSLLSLSNGFERIALAEKNQWLPYYYASFCQVNFCFAQKDKSDTDPIADKAEQLANLADSLSPFNSEISCLRSMIASVRLMVNPMQRYMQYGAESEKQLKLAMAQDSTNPRPYYLKGQSLRYTPEQFGGGCKPAMPLLQTAMEKYDRFKPASELHPAWGRKQAEATLAECLK